MSNANMEITSMLNAWKAGENAALDNLKVGNVFQGCMNVADTLGYDKDSLDHDMAMHGALKMIRKFQVWTDKAGVIVELVER